MPHRHDMSRDETSLFGAVPESSYSPIAVRKDTSMTSVGEKKPETATHLEVDVAVIGTGFAGLYALYKARKELGLRAHAFDDAEGVGGTWYWNRYPGARSDTEVTAYCYSFDRELFDAWKWTAKYPRQSEILAYLNLFADRYDLRRDI